MNDNKTKAALLGASPFPASTELLETTLLTPPRHHAWLPFWQCPASDPNGFNPSKIDLTCHRLNT